jgi:hypothetical protein
LFDASTFVESRHGGTIIPGTDAWQAFHDLPSAVEAAKKMSVNNPKAQIIILESKCIIEPRKIEFAEKMYNSAGELIV